MFSGLTFEISPDFSAAQRKLISKSITDRGGALWNCSVAPIFARRKRSEEPIQKLSFILMEKSRNINISLDRLLQILNINAISQLPDEFVGCIDLFWLNESIRTGELISTNEHLILSHDTIRNIKKSIVDDEESEESRKRQRDSSEDEARRIKSKVHESVYVVPEDRIAKNLLVDQWNETNEMIYFFDSFNHSTSSKCYFFDLDNTLIKTKSGKTFPVDFNDWEWFHPFVPDALRFLARNGAYLCIISNQNGVDKGKVSVSELKTKLNNIRSQLSSSSDRVGIDIFLSIKSHGSLFRKPRIGSLEFLNRSRGLCLGNDLSFENQKSYSKTIFSLSETELSNLASSSINVQQYLERMLQWSPAYVGDAAGREANGKLSKKDFSDTDLKFALNADLKFFTPEFFFCRSKSKRDFEFNLPLPRIWEIAKSPPLTIDGLLQNILKDCMPNKEIVLLVGSIGSGKSTLSRRLESIGYGRVNQDALRTLDKCLANAKMMLTSDSNSFSRGVVVDNTNVEKATRSKWISLAKNLNVQIRCIVMDTPKEICFQLVEYRLLSPLTSREDHREISSIAMHSFAKKFIEQQPSKDEGFYSVESIGWTPEYPNDPIAKKIFESYII